jgi:hypothetical protein
MIGGNTEIEQNPVRPFGQGKRLEKIVEPPVVAPEPVTEGGKPFAGTGKDVRVGVETRHPKAGKARKKGFGVPAFTEGAIQKKGILPPGREMREYLLRHYRGMNYFHPSPRNSQF